jgi:hypothetical protein
MNVESTWTKRSVDVSAIRLPLSSKVEPTTPKPKKA